jgi:carbonic anhydrase
VTTSFDAGTHFDPLHPQALAIYCSDGRFTRAVEELLAHIGYDRLDTMTLPGGPALLNRLSASYADADASAKAASFLIVGHNIEHVVLLAHAGCGYYRAKRPTDSPEQTKTRQIDDLRLAAKALSKVKPDLDVSLYYAQPVGAAVRFEHISHVRSPHDSRR